jgi:hypothetical protein
MNHDLGLGSFEYLADLRKIGDVEFGVIAARDLVTGGSLLLERRAKLAAMAGDKDFHAVIE